MADVTPPTTQANPHNAATDATANAASQALVAAVQNTDNERHDVASAIHSHGAKHPWLQKLVPGIEKLAVNLHAGNFVATRDRSKPPGTIKFFESMPIYARAGMHLLFYGKEQVKLLEAGKIEKLLKEQSVKQGSIYNSPSSKASIPSFIKTYQIQLDELLEPDPNNYATFNEFFFRKLKSGARPVENDTPNAFCCAADCRLTTFQTVSDAQKFWIKGDEFSVSKLLYGKSEKPASGAPFPSDVSLAIFRLAPADYHRFHSPIDGTIVDAPFDIDGTYYTVNPEAVNEVDFDVFTANKRSVIYIKHEESGQLVAFVAIGALLVGAIQWTRKAGETIRKGEELGYFAYGGSTCVAVFPKGLIQFDDDLLTNSSHVLETYVKVGWSLGVRPT